MYLSEYFARQGHEVILSEKEEDFMQRASYVNQARVHNGYHYPRSILTALRSRVSLPRFYEEFHSCIDDTFDKYYMISQLQSKVSASQFEKFCQRIGAICEPAPPKITDLIDPNYIEAVFTTKEFVFDSVKLKKIMLDRIEDTGVKYKLNRYYFFQPNLYRNKSNKNKGELIKFLFHSLLGSFDNLSSHSKRKSSQNCDGLTIAPA